MIGIQNANRSLIYWIGLATAIAQAILGILMTCGVVTADLSGSIMTAFAVIAAWANGNNPNIAGTYNPMSAVRAEEAAIPACSDESENK